MQNYGLARHFKLAYAQFRTFFAQNRIFCVQNRTFFLSKIDLRLG